MTLMQAFSRLEQRELTHLQRTRDSSYDAHDALSSLVAGMRLQELCSPHLLGGEDLTL